MANVDEYRGRPEPGKPIKKPQPKVQPAPFSIDFVPISQVDGLADQSEIHEIRKLEALLSQRRQAAEDRCAFIKQTQREAKSDEVKKGEQFVRQFMHD
jgi:hypothetical protein